MTPAARKDDEISHSAAIITKGVGAAFFGAIGGAIGIAATIIAAPIGIGIAIGFCATVALAAEGAAIGADISGLGSADAPSGKRGWAPRRPERHQARPPRCCCPPHPARIG